MATACIPWTVDNHFDEVSFRKQMPLLAQVGVQSVYLFGTAGEGYAVDDAQYLEIVRAFVDEAQVYKDMLPMVGVICLAPNQVLRRIEEAAVLGVKDFQISLPCWGALQDKDIFNYFHYVCDRFPQLRFMHYNTQLRTHVKLNGAQYARLCEEVPNLVAVKHTGASMEEILDLMIHDLPLQLFFLEGAYGYACLAGQAGLLISLCNISPPLARKYYIAGQTKDVATIMALEKEFVLCNHILTKHLPGNLMDGAYDKLFVKYAIPNFPHRLYPPYQGVCEEAFVAFDMELRRRLPQWFEES